MAFDPSQGPNMAAITSMNLAAVGNSPTAGMPTRIFGVSALSDIQLQPILALKGFNADKPILGKQGGKPPGFFGKILADMGFSAQNLQQGFSQVRSGGDQV